MQGQNEHFCKELFYCQLSSAQINAHGRALPGPGLYGDAVPQVVADALAQVQPDAAGLPVGASGEAGVALLEHARQVLRGDTDSCVFDTGAYASSGTFFSGNASLVATKKLKEKIIAEAALQMEEDPADLDVRAPGEVFSKKTGKSITYGELSHTAISGTPLLLA